MSDIHNLVEKLSGIINSRLEAAEDGSCILAGRDQLIPLMQVLRDKCGYSLLADITAVDYTEFFEIVYHVSDFDANLLKIKVRLDRTDASVPSLTGVWKAAGVQEREAYDLMGIVFSGHQDLRRILCRDGFEGHPLRKDFKLEPASRF